ncbi:MAG: carboxypeptidase M32 [Pseudomonadota bacterium]|nr:carboxypeptidase M32 [Pseudomonadota bacterium]
MGVDKTSSYLELEDRFSRIALVRQSSAILSWDWATMMPEGAARARAAQLAELEKTSHERLVDPQMEDLLARAEQESAVQSDLWLASNLAQMRQQWRQANALSSRLVESLAITTSACEVAWRSARESANFADIIPEFSAVVDLVREKAASLSESFGLSPYDCLLHQYEQSLTGSDVDSLFSDLLDFLPSVLSRALDEQGELRQFGGPFPLVNQEILNRKIMGIIGFPFDKGRLDISHHPFSGGGPEDLRITTRYDEQDFTSSFMAVLHETGHALYEYGLPARWRGQPVGEALGMVIHESQSLLIEMQVCRSREFVELITPHIRDAFEGLLLNLDEDELRATLCKVEPGFIRVEADEVTYPFHIILRYRLERLLIEGELKVEDLPTAWREGMKELLGIEPVDDAAGCLQDIHWYGGDFGYFPTYTLGAVAAAQLFSAAVAKNTDILSSIRLGNFEPLLKWLDVNVHSLGCSISAFSLIEKATGASLSTKSFEQHLRARYC